MRFYLLLVFLILTIIDKSFEQNLNQTFESNVREKVTRNVNTVSTLDVLYLVPEELDDVFVFNEKSTFGNEYKQGWILPSDTPLTLNLYLYYDGTDERRLNALFNTNLRGSNTNVPSTNQTELYDPKQNTNSISKETLYMFFTPEKDCKDYMKRNSWPFEIVEKIADNMYMARLNSIVLPHSPKPYYICMQQFDTDTDLRDSFRFYSHQGDDYWISIVTTKSLLPIWARIILFVMLLSLSGLFSGLNLGLMSLDLSELEILKRIGTPNEQMYASKIYPLRKRGNFLLCTILLGNVLVNSVSTLILGDMLSGIYAALGSTLLIVIFGEIIPQSACSKHGLAVGASTRHIMYFFMIVTSPLSFPLSIVLDKVLGQEITATYNREKIRELMKNMNDLGEKEYKIISGALDFNKKKVKEVMTKLDDVFMLDKNSRLDFETIAKIAQEGYSRIPVYEGTKENVVGLLHVKDFTLLDPDDNMPVKALLEFYNHKVIYCDAERAIDEMFEEFRKGETHLAFVTEIIQETDQDPYDLCVGIVTLEDILEELVQMEIYDEFDDKKDIEQEEFKEQEKLERNRRSGSFTSRSSKSSDDSSSTKSDEKRSIKHIKRSSLEVPVELSPVENGASLAGTLSETNPLIISNTDSSKALLTQQKSSSSSSTAVRSSLKSGSAKAPHPHYESQASKDLSFFLQQQKDSAQRTLISPQIRFVMFQFLFTTVKPFTSEFLTKNVLELIFKRATFKESRRTDPKSPPDYLYHYGKGCNYFILILSGEATIEVGKEKLEFPAGPFAYFGMNALLCGAETVDQVLQEEHSPQPSPMPSPSTSEESKTIMNSKFYVPDFSLRVDTKCVYMKIDRDLWRNGVIKSRYEILNNHKSDSIDYFPSNSDQPTDSDVASLNNSKVDISPHHLLLLKQIKDPYKSKLSIKSTRRSTIAANALAKAQQASNAKNQSQLVSNKESPISSKGVVRNENSKESLNSRSMTRLDMDSSNYGKDDDKQPIFSKKSSSMFLKDSKRSPSPDV